MAAINDHMIYLIVVGHPKGDYIPERDVADLDRATTIKDIAAGEYEDVKQVLELNPVEGICRDVTDDICRDVMTAWADEAEPLANWQYEFIELHVSSQAAQSFRRAA